MADPLQVESVSGVRAVPAVGHPQEIRATARPGGSSDEGLPSRVTRSEAGAEPKEEATTRMLHEKMQQFMADLGPIRMRFLVDQETRAVRIRIINAASGEIIREIPPGDLTRPPEPPEHA